jgi:hypothetical protein
MEHGTCGALKGTMEHGINKFNISVHFKAACDPADGEGLLGALLDFLSLSEGS